MSHSIYIAYGSESGNAKKLANTLHQNLTAASFNPHPVVELNDVELDKLSQDSTLLILTSNFGDGEPPGNAELFYNQILEDTTTANFNYAMFGLGDVSYPKFCGFSIEADERLKVIGAKAIAQRVDADVSYQRFFEKWNDALIKHFSGDSETLNSLLLQVKAYGENQYFEATIGAISRIDKGNFPAYDIHIDIANSGMNYEAGDLLYLLPPVNSTTFANIKAFYGSLTTEQEQLLASKELRLLSKPLFRAFAKQTKSDELKALTKIKAAKELATYMYGHDISDMLNDYCTPDSMPVDTLIELLSAQMPRAYSIASCGSTTEHSVRLCIREVTYQIDNKVYYGSASHFLANSQKGDKVSVYLRANPHFHTPEDKSKPLIMIGAGTGVAPYLGFLTQARTGETHLFFGERYAEKDFLYQTELEELVATQKLTQIHTAFSRDQAEKIYVQDRLIEQAEKVWQLIEDRAEIYVCGSKVNLGKSVDNALMQIAQSQGGLDEDAAKQWLHDMVSTLRYHQDSTKYYCSIHTLKCLENS